MYAPVSCSVFAQTAVHARGNSEKRPATRCRWCEPELPCPLHQPSYCRTISEVWINFGSYSVNAAY